MVARYSLILADQMGKQYADLTDAKVTRAAKRLAPAIGELSYEIPTKSFKALGITPITREMQLWRNGVLTWVGPITNISANKERMRVTAKSLLWYFYKRIFGPPINMLVNPDFENGLTAWAANGAASSVSVTTRARGNQAARLTTAAGNSDHYITQRFQIDDASPAGGTLRFTLSAWYYI